MWFLKSTERIVGRKTLHYCMTELSWARPHTLHSHVGKVDVAGSTYPLLTNRMCKKKRPLQKMAKQRWWQFWSWRRKLDGVFHPTPPFWTGVHSRRTNHAWPFQRDYVMCEVTHTHCRASARQIFVVKEYICFYLLKKITNPYARYSLAGVM